MKIIHCSDIHLDSKMESNFSFKQAQERNNEICITFSQMIEYAEKNDVSVVMIAGDLFDSDRISVRTSDLILDYIEQAEKIDFLYLKGNHDEGKQIFAGRDIPKNLKLFSDKWKSYNYGNITISGVELNRNNYGSIYQSLNLDNNLTNIVMMHGQESSSPGEDCVCIPLLRGKNIDYLALGHIHSFRKEKLDNFSEYCYCGCLEGRGFDECGKKGFVLLDIQGKHIESKFVPCAKRKLHDVAVNISGKTTVTDILKAMTNAASGISSKDLVKFTLTGTYNFETQKDLNFFHQKIDSKYYFVKIKDESTLEIEKASYENDISLKGEFIRMVMNSSLDKEDKDKIICTGIQALSGEEITL